MAQNIRISKRKYKPSALPGNAWERFFGYEVAATAMVSVNSGFNY